MMTPDALFEAIHREDVERVRAILDGAPELLNVRDGNGDAPIHAAVEVLSAEVVRLLLERGARANVPDGSGQTPLDVLQALNREMSDSKAGAILEIRVLLGRES